MFGNDDYFELRRSDFPGPVPYVTDRVTEAPSLSGYSHRLLPFLLDLLLRMPPLYSGH